MNRTILASQLSVYNGDKSNTYNGLPTNLDWLAETFSHRSAPAIKGSNGRWRTLPRTLTKEQFLNYWRSQFETVALRFPKETNRLVLDIDRGSPHHPATDRESFNLILETLEDVGLVSPVIYQSSESGGLHILYPLSEPRTSYGVGRAVEMALAAAGFILKSGALEIFPHRKNWIERGKEYPKGIKAHELTNYGAVRVPLQAGCVLLDSLSLEPLADNSLGELRWRWEWCASRQDMQSFDSAIEFYSDWQNWPKCKLQWRGGVQSEAIASGDILEVLGHSENQYRRGEQRLQTMANQYEALKARGWRSTGETQPIIKHLTRLTRIFIETTDAADLADKVVAIARTMPGFRQHSKHTADIERVALGWARTAIKKGYRYHVEYLGKETKGKKETNEQRQQRAIKRIKNCLKGFAKQGFTYASKTAIIAAVVRAVRCSKTTVIKHWDKFVSLAKQLLTNTTPQQPPKPEPDNDTGKMAGGSTHPSLHSLSNVNGGASEPDLPCPFEDDWEPPPPPKPRFCFEFNDFAQTLPPPTEAPDYAKIPDYISRAFAAMVRTAYSPDFESLQAIAGELNRCRPGVIVRVLEWIESLPVVPERQQPKPPKPDKDEIQELKKIRRKANFRRFKASAGGCRA